MIKAVIFDLSDVCFNAEEPPFIKAFAEKHGLDVAEFEQRYLEMLHRAENHEISGTYIWEEISRHYSIPLNPKRVIQEMIDGKERFEETFALVKKLRETVKTAFFTNYNETYWNLIDKKFHLARYFDAGLVSYEIGARKPAVKGFEYLLNKLGVKPEEAVFTDDTSKNLDNARSLGIHTIQFTNIEEFTRKLRVLGVEVQ